MTKSRVFFLEFGDRFVYDDASRFGEITFLFPQRPSVMRCGQTVHEIQRRLDNHDYNHSVDYIGLTGDSRLLFLLGFALTTSARLLLWDAKANKYVERRTYETSRTRSH